MPRHVTDKDSSPAQPRKSGAGFRVAGWVVVVFGLLFLLTGLRFETTEQLIVDKILASQAVGPIEVEKPSTPLRITLTHTPFKASWTYVATTLVNSNGQAVGHSNDEFFHEPALLDTRPAQLRDKSDFSMTVFAPGDYFLHFRAEGAAQGDFSTVDRTDAAILGVRVESLFGDSSNFYWGGWALLAYGMILVLAGGGKRAVRTAPGGGRRKTVLALSLVLLALYTFLLFEVPVLWADRGSKDSSSAAPLGITGDNYETRSVREVSLGGPQYVGGGFMAGK